MAALYFIWKGVDSQVMNIRVLDRIQIVKPEERIEHVTIPGRSGDLTLTEGENVFQSYIQTVNISVNGLANMRAAETWLSGAGTITFYNQPTLFQNARVIGAVTFEKHSRNMDAWTAEVQFYCEPVKHLITEPTIDLDESGAEVVNPGDFAAKPLITIHGSGLVTVSIGTKTITIPEALDGMVIDCENEWVTVNGLPQMNAFSGQFPQIPTGESVVLFTGATGVTIEPRWNYI